MNALGGNADLSSLLGPLQDNAGGEEEPLNQEEIMDNARTTHEIFIQNQLKSISHSIQWLNHSEDDPDHPNFTFEYLLLGTHRDEEGEEEN